MEPHRLRPLLFVVAAWALVAMPGLLMGIHADDWFQLRPRPAAEVLATFRGDWNSGERGLATGFYRPLSRVAFAVDHAVWGLRPWGLHLTNGLLFLAVVLAVYRGALILTAGRRRCSALAAALVALTPAKCEGLYWLSGRTDLLAAAFALWGVWCALRSLERGGAALAMASPLLVFAGLLAKEVAAAALLIVPLAAWLLRPIGARRTEALLLVGGSAAVLILYALLRADAVGGVGGYYAARAEPLPVGEALGNIARMVGAIGLPGTGMVLGRWSALAGLLWSFSALIVLVALGTPRPLLWSLAAMIVALAPMAGLPVSIGDGGRVLTLALGFWGMAAAVVAARLLRWSGCAKPMGLAGLALGGLWLALTWVEATRWIVAAGPNHRAIQAAFAHLRDNPAPLVLPDPAPRPATRVRILEPGTAIFLAMQTLWLDAHGAAGTAIIRDLRLVLERADVRRVAYPFPLPEMEEGTTLANVKPNGDLVLHPLLPAMRWAWPSPEGVAPLVPVDPTLVPEALLVLEARGGLPTGLLVIEAEPLLPPGHGVRITAADGGLRGAGELAPLAGPGAVPARSCAWMRHGSGDARRIALVPPPAGGGTSPAIMRVTAWPFAEPAAPAP